MGGWVVAHKILVTALSPNSSFPLWAWTWDLDSGLSITLLILFYILLYTLTNIRIYGLWHDYKSDLHLVWLILILGLISSICHPDLFRESCWECCDSFFVIWLGDMISVWSIYLLLVCVGSWLSSGSAHVFWPDATLFRWTQNLLLGILLGFQTNSFNCCQQIVSWTHSGDEAYCYSQIPFHKCHQQPISCDQKSQNMTISFPVSNAILSFQRPTSKKPFNLTHGSHDLSIQTKYQHSESKQGYIS